MEIIKQPKKLIAEIKINDNVSLRYVDLSDDYKKKWNISLNDFVQIYNNNKRVSKNLYRVGGFGSNPNKSGYFILLKQIESFYSDYITTDKKRKKHLASTQVIIDKNGIEKIVAKEFDNIYLTGGIVYSSKGDYYNIETGERYCNSYTSMETENFIFLHNEYDKDKTKRGVLKINKLDGSFELIV